jgi:hypothetical protein
MGDVATVNCFRSMLNQIHGANHSTEEIGVPDKNLIFTIPDAAVNVLRRMALRLKVDDNQMKLAALSLPSHPDEENIGSYIDRLRRRIDAKLTEVNKMPQHFILDDTLWPKQSYIIQMKHLRNFLAVICLQYNGSANEVAIPVLAIDPTLIAKNPEKYMSFALTDMRQRTIMVMLSL